VFTRKRELSKALNRRVAVNLVDNGVTLFVGRLAGFDKDTYVLEQCETAPGPGETPNSLPGRQYIDRIHAFITEST
jgi:small nuclear ribonucleoprotein (snRNP)-like protein